MMQTIPVRALAAAAVVALLATQGVGCNSEPPPSIPACAAMPQGLERDQCTFQQLLTLGPAEITMVSSLAASIRDPIVRGAAVTRWVAEHGHLAPREQGLKLCGLLGEREEGVCVRRLVSAHLQPSAPAESPK